MAKYFYFTRHGQTVWNVENKICGATDIALTDLGHQQAAELGERILKEGIKIDEILYSPLMRAADTAKHISEVTGIPAREELRLKEQNFGKYESTPRNGEEFKRAKQDFVCRYEGGESMLQLLGFCHLADNQVQPVRCLFVQIGKGSVELAGQKQVTVNHRAKLFQIGLVQPSPVTNGAVFLRQLQIRHIVIAHQHIVHAVFVDSRF